LRNAFVQALGAGISGTVGIKTLEESLQNESQERDGEGEAAAEDRPDPAEDRAERRQRQTDQ
jgi:hypothetical protein